MPFQRPTLSALARQALADLATATGALAILRTSPLAILAKAVSGLVHGLYGYLDWLARQAVPITAEAEYLLMWAGLVDVRQKPASLAYAEARFTGTPGSVLRDGTVVVRSDGVAYRTAGLVTMGPGGSLIVGLEAVEPGAAGNALIGAEVVISAAVLGINAAGLLTAPATGGADEETEGDFRERMLERYREPPQGGAESDYSRWSKEVPGITRAWVSPVGAGAGTVVVYVMLDEARADVGGFPQGVDGVASREPRGRRAAGDQLLVADYLFPLRPVTAQVFVVAPVPLPVDLRITNLHEDTAETRAAIERSLADMFLRKGEPGGAIYQSDIVAAIDAAPGVNRFRTTVDDVQAPVGRLPVLGSITWG